MILITGGAGFIGSALIRKIIGETNSKIINIDKLTYAGSLSNLDPLIKLKNYNNYKFINADINDKELLVSIFREYEPKSIIHLAAESHVDNSIESSSEFIETNVIGTYKLLEVSRNYFSGLSGNKKSEFKFHHVSTDEVYGDLEEDDPPFSELNPYRPSSPYSSSKACSDHLVRAWGRTYNLPYLITNCSNNYGPFQFPEKLIPKTILNALSGKKIPIYGNGEQIRDWLYVDDHAEALMKVHQLSKYNETYNIGGVNEISNLKVVESICDLLQEMVSVPDGVSQFKDLISFVEDRPGHDMRYAIDNTKILSELSWAPQESFSSGLRKTVKWYIENLEWVKNLD